MVSEAENSGSGVSDSGLSPDPCRRASESGEPAALPTVVRGGDRTSHPHSDRSTAI